VYYFVSTASQKAVSGYILYDIENVKQGKKLEI